MLIQSELKSHCNHHHTKENSRLNIKVSCIVCNYFTSYNKNNAIRVCVICVLPIAKLFFHTSVLFTTEYPFIL